MIRAGPSSSVVERQPLEAPPRIVPAEHLLAAGLFVGGQNVLCLQLHDAPQRRGSLRELLQSKLHQAQVVERAARGSSLVIGAYGDGLQVGYTRIVSDRATFAWVCDVFVHEAYRGKGLARAMALFAHIAAPQVRLTKDPNTFFFFLDHLAQESPFRLEDDTTWDTNIELGIAWGMRLIEKDTELYGKSPNAKTFVLITDGQSWSGEVARSLKLARTNDVPVWVVGVGTTVGAFIPEPERKPNEFGAE